MGYRFSVDLTALERAADGVNDVIGEVGELDLAHLPTGSDMTGDDGLAEVLGDFGSRWQRGIQDLAAEGQQIAGRLNYAVSAYARYEEAIRKAAGGGAVTGDTASGQTADPGVPG